MPRRCAWKPHLWLASPECTESHGASPVGQTRALAKHGLEKLSCNIGMSSNWLLNRAEAGLAAGASTAASSTAYAVDAGADGSGRM